MAIPLAGALPLLAALLAACAPAPKPQASPIRITGSSTVFPILERAIAGYGATARGRGVKLELSEVGTSAGLRAFCSGEAPLANASRPISTEELQACADTGITFIELPLAFDALTVAVNSDNSWATSISTQELQRTWSRPAQGRVTRWGQINNAWPDRPLRLCAPGADSGTFDYFNEAINGGKTNARTDVESSEDDTVLVECVARDPNAMAYFGIAYYTANAARIRALSIAAPGREPVPPSVSAVQKGLYKPLARPLFLYVNDRAMRADDEIRSFVGYTVGNGLRFVEQAGFIPLPADTYRLVESKLYRPILGTSFGGDLPVGLGIEAALRRSFDDTRKPEFR
ncbi:phosphate ABC transporter substrate-binding protein PstS family protein [Cyanobium sp. NIES-981]|uniref:phosphate ABC transporter substrate-binding protein PstS family protein n=1 Tax=Cyanobium sp. NIES-981 TaxID=1851505 RepID=UPI0007DDE34E|nr:phosphate ABC transporter substrate-binding protein PstS family protein [Cyanobium sp. NIES-981]SBO43255.1 ABC transporter, substrate binding protein component, possibly phosphate [Cyanobium sp. NIES-981]